MEKNPRYPKRKSLRLKGYNYSDAGLYFITICTHGRECLFGKIENGEMKLNEYGEIARKEWELSATKRAEMELDCFVVMPNHLHGIVIINENVRRGDRPVARYNEPVDNMDSDIIDIGDFKNKEGDQPVAPNYGTGDRPVAPTNDKIRPKGPRPKSLGAMVAGYKSAVTVQINTLRHMPRFPVWQRNFHDHIIRDRQSYYIISEYIRNNPLNWKDDSFFNET